jgi:hypothetical protein
VWTVAGERGAHQKDKADANEEPVRPDRVVDAATKKGLLHRA